MGVKRNCTYFTVTLYSLAVQREGNFIQWWNPCRTDKIYQLYSFATLLYKTAKQSLFFRSIRCSQRREAPWACLSPVPLSVFTLAPDLSFEDRASYAKNTTVLQSIVVQLPLGIYPLNNCSNPLFKQLATNLNQSICKLSKEGNLFI